MCVIFLLWTLYFFTALRFKALRGTKYSVFSPRGIAGVFIITAVVFCTIYTVLFVWNYSVWFEIRRMGVLAKTSRDDEMIPIVQEMIPGNRKAVSYWYEDGIKAWSADGSSGCFRHAHAARHGLVAGQDVVSGHLLRIPRDPPVQDPHVSAHYNRLRCVVILCHLDSDSYGMERGDKPRSVCRRFSICAINPH